MVCSCPLGALALGFPGRYRPRSASTCFLPRATLPEVQSNLRWLLVVLGFEIPRRSQAVNLGWLLLVLGLGLMRPAVACLRGFRNLCLVSQDQPFIWRSSVGGVGWGRVLRDLQGVLNSVSQVDGVADRAPACQLCGRRV